MILKTNLNVDWEKEANSENLKHRLGMPFGEAVFPISYGDVRSRAFDELAGRIKAFDSNPVNYEFFA